MKKNPQKSIHQKDSRLSESELNHRSSGKALGVGKRYSSKKGLFIKAGEMQQNVTGSRRIVVLKKKFLYKCLGIKHFFPFPLVLRKKS